MDLTHDVPEKDGKAVWMGDGHHGTSLFWSEQRDAYVAVDHENDRVTEHERLLLIEGGDWDAFDDILVATDGDNPNGLCFVGIDEDTDVGKTILGTIFMVAAEMLWDSATAEEENESRLY